MMKRKLLIVSLLSATLLGSSPMIVSAQERDRSGQRQSTQNRFSPPQQRTVNGRHASDNRRSRPVGGPAQRMERQRSQPQRAQQGQNRIISGENRFATPQRRPEGVRAPSSQAYRQDGNRYQGQPRSRDDGAVRNAQNRPNAPRQWQDQRGNRYDRDIRNNRQQWNNRRDNRYDRDVRNNRQQWNNRRDNRNYATTNWNNRSSATAQRYNQRYNWNQNWRQDQRYNWHSYRNRNQNRYRYTYVVPRGWDYGYRRFSIGVSLWGGLFGSNYWINDPYYYRLPPAYGDLRWIRYFDDAMLVDIRSGYVVDVIYNFFW